MTRSRDCRMSTRPGTLSKRQTGTRTIGHFLHLKTPKAPRHVSSYPASKPFIFWQTHILSAAAITAGLAAYFLKLEQAGKLSIDRSPLGLKAYITSNDLAWARTGQDGDLLSIWNGATPAPQSCPWSDGKRDVARGESVPPDVCKLPRPSGSVSSRGTGAKSPTVTTRPPSTFITSTVPFPHISATPSPTVSICLSSAAYTSCHFVGGGHSPVCQDVPTCVRWAPKSTPPPGTRCERDSECDKYECVQGSKPGCWVNAMGGVKYGMCQCLPNETIQPTTETPSPTTSVVYVPTGTPPPAQANCNTTSDCTAWTCADGLKPVCDTQASGDPFSKTCRGG